MSEIVGRRSNIENAEVLRAGANTPPQWFALYTSARHEKHVSEILTQRQIETFLPLYRTTRRWKKSRPVDLELPLFPTYVFARVAQKTRSTALGTPGVLSIVGSAREPWIVPDSDIEAIRLGLQMGKVDPHPYLVVGERARVASGVLTGLEGIIVRKKNNFHIVLSLDQIMRSIAIEVDASELEPVSQTPN